MMALFFFPLNTVVMVYIKEHFGVGMSVNKRSFETVKHNANAICKYKYS